jgi:hypothetical protein
MLVFLLGTKVNFSKVAGMFSPQVRWWIFLHLILQYRLFSDQVGLRLIEGNVRTQPLSSLPVLDCGMAYENTATGILNFPVCSSPTRLIALRFFFQRRFCLQRL